MGLRIEEFDYQLPTERIAQHPVTPRDASRLLVMDRHTKQLTHHTFIDFPQFLKPGDILVFNDTKVIPAALTGKKRETGGKVELLLVRRFPDGSWEVMAKPARRLTVGSMVDLVPSQLTARVEAILSGRTRRMVFSVNGWQEGSNSLPEVWFRELTQFGKVPLPPYIHTADPNQFREQYQTIYAKREGAVAAPTAGLHFTERVFQQLAARGVACVFVTLHTGLPTFSPVETEFIEDHVMGKETYVLSRAVLEQLRAVKQNGGRVIAVGTTTVRVLESAARQLPPHQEEEVISGETDLFIYPGFSFQIVDALLTNFHLPRSTLLMLVAAFAGKDLVKQAYETAIEERYRFFSFGDAMLIY